MEVFIVNYNNEPIVVLSDNDYTLELNKKKACDLIIERATKFFPELMNSKSYSCDTSDVFIRIQLFFIDKQSHVIYGCKRTILNI